MTRKSAAAFTMFLSAFTAVVIQYLLHGDESGWGGLAPKWVTRTYAAIVCVIAWRFASSVPKLASTKWDGPTFVACAIGGRAGMLWLCFMAYVTFESLRGR